MPEMRWPRQRCATLLPYDARDTLFLLVLCFYEGSVCKTETAETRATFQAAR